MCVFPEQPRGTSWLCSRENALTKNPEDVRVPQSQKFGKYTTKVEIQHRKVRDGKLRAEKSLNGAQNQHRVGE